MERRFWPVRLAAALCCCQPVIAQQTNEIVRVVGQTPLGANIDADQIAANAQHIAGEVIAAQRSLSLPEFMQRNLGSVFINEAQNNPLQPDVQYRGFVGSPLLGLSQGIAVYQDGVRLNEPFGDTVNWALLPESAIESMVLMPGSNPLFGLNALGGAIAVETKDGFTSPGTRGEIFGGSFGRTGFSLSTGGSSNEFGYFFTGDYLDEDGWRDFSPTEAVQLFGKVGWRRQATSIDLGLAVTETDLIGNGPLPAQLLAIDRDAIFTRPDRTENDLALANLSVEHLITDRLSLTGNLYFRNSDIHTLNGDDSDVEECSDSSGFLCIEEDGIETLVLDVDSNAIVASDSLEGASINRTNTLQDGKGFGLQVVWETVLAGRKNQLLAGLVYDDGSISFDAASELGALDATRRSVPGGVFIGEAETRLDAETSNTGVFLSNTIALGERIHLTTSGRYNHTDIVLRDQLGTALNGNHSYRRFNLAVGVTTELETGVTAYAGFNQSSRAPSPVELTCADEDDPCRLPNAFLADPPLEQVVAHTFEAGLRGGDPVEWHAGFFRTTSRDDIQFISAGALTGQGFFDNVGRTRRDGVELNLTGGADEGLRWFANYTFVDATFRESLVFGSPNNPAAVDGEVAVQPGDQLPLIPNRLLKAGFDLILGDRFKVGASVDASSGFNLRGDEGNDSRRLGRAVRLNLRTDYRVNEQVTFFLKVDNLFDREQETFGLFGDAAEVLGDEFDDPRFLSPSAPRSAWAGVQIDL